MCGWTPPTLKQRQGGRIVSVAAIIAVAANTEGRREIIGLVSAIPRRRRSGSTFSCSRKRRGLKGVKLAITDAQKV